MIIGLPIHVENFKGRGRVVTRSKSKLTLAVAGVVSALSMGAATQNAEAANWLMMQGTENPGAVGRAKVWGFVQADAQLVDGTTVPAGKWKGSHMQPNTIGPDRTSRATFNIRRARIGVRGQGFPLDNKVNYFLLAEYGHNGVNSVGGGTGATYLTDASVTLNHVPYARLRIGQFKTPGSEEALQAIHVFDYVSFTNVTDQLLLERFADGDGSSTVNTPITADQGAVNKPNGGVGAFRDVGVQLFDTIKMKNLEVSYAGMIGNGNGINRQDNNGAKDYYGYVAAEQIFGGKGARRQSVKGYAWFHKGKRTLTTENPGEYDRDRSGLGFTFRKAKYRAAGEFVSAKGMTINGTDGAAQIGSTSSDDVKSSLNFETNGEANGYYLHGGYQVMKNLELDLRYDVLNRSTHSAAKERKFATTTIGAQYFLNKKTRLVFNYEFRSLDVPNPAAIESALIAQGGNANQAAAMKKAALDNAEAIDDRISVQILAIF